MTFNVFLKFRVRNVFVYSITFHELLLYCVNRNMFRLIPFQYRLCALGKSYDVIADACRNKNELFSFLESRQWRGFNRSVANFFSCDISFFHIYYWYLLVFSLYGAMHSLYNFGRLFFTKEMSRTSLWHNHRFYVLPPFMIRRLRIVKAFIQINSWATLLYAALYVSPRHMCPWLWVHVFIFVLKLAASTMNTILGRLKGQQTRTIIYLIVYVLIIWLVNQSMKAFTIALKQETPEKLMLYSQIIHPILRYGNSIAI
ncbi:uncharacterized protein LOC108146412 [Drosophila elegans]|uniref:uncharacterized protein LOC108146412 n=1 Tax=Drosophila elegans TaxID=30023 RepID=UPI0007E73AE5|nr:uncharacterized protein LOC108146412 [Drosophila elegans]